MKILISAALLVTLSAPALAAGEAEGSGASEPRRERRICRAIDGRTSQTRVQPRRLCLTESQWRARTDPDVDQAVAILETRTAPAPSTTYQGGMGAGPN